MKEKKLYQIELSQRVVFGGRVELTEEEFKKIKKEYPDDYELFEYLSF